MKTAIDSIPRTRGRARAALILLPALLLAAHAARGGSLDAFPDGDFEATSSHGKMGEFGEAGQPKLARRRGRRAARPDDASQLSLF